MLKDFIILLLGFTLLVKCSEYMIDAASKIAKIFKIPPFIIGFSIIAFGTSAPELVISIITGVSKINEITLGNVIGSGINNVALVIGISAILRNIHIEKAVLKKEIPLSIAVQVFLMILLFIGGVLSRLDGIILLLCFVVFLFYIFTRSKDSIYVDEEDVLEYNISQAKKESTLTLAIILICSIAGIIFGGNFVVQSSTAIARAFGVSEVVIGLTIVSIGTSLPELITTIIAILKDKSDIAIGNVIGSNIFNVLLVLGVSSVINPILLPKGIHWDFLIVFGATTLLLLLSFREKQLKKYSGIILLLYYVGYILLKILTSLFA